MTVAATVPAPASPNETYWSALDEGRLTFQRCAACANAWAPAREECPRCWSPDWAWEEASGGGTVVSWVVFHVSFLEGFKDRLPYNVAVVEIAEGPRLVTNLVNAPDGEDLVGRSVSLVIEREDGRALPRFRLEKPDGSER
jgi:uncharacterized OB-fold protein